MSWWLSSLCESRVKVNTSEHGVFPEMSRAMARALEEKKSLPISRSATKSIYEKISHLGDSYFLLPLSNGNDTVVYFQQKPEDIDGGHVVFFETKPKRTLGDRSVVA
ncbi:unnamed protein product [Clavelina lepadiformis]|uniref:Uncharacterized protein n=1 Tax=Clavelina lepadiformis TaxID=159417 RepID=A0ABP0FQ53_CLALP